ncbi:MAG TPA: CHASE2 domain-containing protein [Bryobacteraceae bacterium]|nr:CHASE2 domain-containing protein [Bryobacteraceae bacterium]
MQSKPYRRKWGYAAVAAAGFAIGMAAGWNPLAARIDHYAYDYMTRGAPAPDWKPQSVVVAIDAKTFEARGGTPAMRAILAEALDKLALAKPSAVAIDVILHDALRNPAGDARLEAALRATHNLILPCEIVNGKWEDPLPEFKRDAAALGHVERPEDRLDGVSREIPLEEIRDGQRRWAMSLEAFRLARGQPIIESPDELEIGDTAIPAARGPDDRPLYIRYLPPGRIPVVSVLDIDRHRDAIRGKTVFLGVTDLSAAKDRLINPFGDYVPGVGVNAHAFETLMRGQFLSPARDATVLLVCAGFAAAAGLIFAFAPGWLSYALVLPLLGFAHYVPALFFHHGAVFPYFAPVAVAWLCAAGAATYQHFFVRRQLVRSESERSRYQQAIHWAAHEMRTPLTAIQGSSEIMSRYKLPDEKRNQLSEMINSESKRLSRIIQTFLDVERMAEGQMELKREPFPASEIVATCLNRVTPLAERKQIAMELDHNVEGVLIGDRELMEYAFYNLLTNAVKYSPSGTRVNVISELRGTELRLAVKDEGIGMDAKELKNIFKKFYRTKKAEASGEAGTGIGLSIVEQIVTHHGGRIGVTSEPGKGSCFTMILKVEAGSGNAATVDR